MQAQDKHPQHDPLLFARNMMEASQKAQAAFQSFLTRQAADALHTPADPLNVAGAFMEMAQHLMNNPGKLVEKQAELWKSYLDIWEHTTHLLLGEESRPPVEADSRDKRFKDPAWQQSVVFDFIKQSYLATSRWMQQTVGEVEGLSPQDAKKLEFYTRQFVDAMAPSNFMLTNPEVLRVTLETGGENLVKGLNNMLEDLERGKGSLRISMTDYEAFEIGRNIVLTPGKVVFRNDLIELLQYTPSTKEVLKTPLLFIPAWINKYYIADMQPDNSIVKWLVEQGHTVFVISWVNPDERLSRKTFDDYMLEGPLAAMDAIEKATGEKKINAVGYCLGGTLLSVTLAWLHAKGQEERIASATYLTTMVDFTEAGELSVFIDEEQITQLESKMEEKGYLEGSEMAMTFQLLRSNDLIWSFVVNNYLLGKDPFPFDLLYWNADSTRMPAAMHSFYLRNMYQQNRLAKPGGITIAGEKIDLTKIKTPTLIVSAREDHIAPWKSTYAATQLYKGPVEFLLAASGHIAGVVNPPARKKYSYWTADKKHPKGPDDWFKAAKETPGSWWPHWDEFLKENAGGKVPAREPGAGKLKVLGDAPGTYVKVMSNS